MKTIQRTHEHEVQYVSQATRVSEITTNPDWTRLPYFAAVLPDAAAVVLAAEMNAVQVYRVRAVQA